MRRRPLPAEDEPPPRDPGPLFGPKYLSMPADLLERSRREEALARGVAAAAPASGPGTSAAAAAAVDHLERVGALAALASRRGAEGFTDEEAEEPLGLAGNSLRPLRWRAVDLGVVVLTSRTRPTRSGRAAMVWVLRDHATAEDLEFTRTYLASQRHARANRARSVELLLLELDAIGYSLGRPDPPSARQVLARVRSKMEELGLVGPKKEDPRDP